MTYFQAFIVAHEDGTAEGAHCLVGDGGCVPALAGPAAGAGGMGS